MSKMQPIAPDTTPSTQANVDELMKDLSSAASALQSFLDHQNGEAIDSIHLIPAILKQAQEAFSQVEARRQQSEAELEKAQRKIRNFDDLQALLDILPVGIVISHDPQNHQMTINRTGLQYWTCIRAQTRQKVRRAVKSCRLWSCATVKKCLLKSFPCNMRQPIRSHYTILSWM